MSEALHKHQGTIPQSPAWTAVWWLIGIATTSYPSPISGFRHVQGGLGDTRLVNFTLGLAAASAIVALSRSGRSTIVHIVRTYPIKVATGVPTVNGRYGKRPGRCWQLRDVHYGNRGKAAKIRANLEQWIECRELDPDRVAWVVFKARPPQ